MYSKSNVTSCQAEAHDHANDNLAIAFFAASRQVVARGTRIGQLYQAGSHVIFWRKIKLCSILSLFFIMDSYSNNDINFDLAKTLF